MKKYLLPLSVALLASGAVLAVPAEKVTICHATSDPGHYNRIVVNANAIGGHFDNPGSPKAGHEDDILLQGEVECPGTTVPEEPVNPTPPAPTPTPPAPTPTPTPVTPTTTSTSTPAVLPAVGADGK